MKAIGDLQKYWADEYPKLYGKPYKPVEGGFYSVMPSKDDPPPCTKDVSEVSGNAFYCSSKDVVAWDAEGLLPDLQSKFGDFVIPIVFAHEWGARGAGPLQLHGPHRDQGVAGGLLCRWLGQTRPGCRGLHRGQRPTRRRAGRHPATA